MNRRALAHVKIENVVAMYAAVREFNGGTVKNAALIRVAFLIAPMKFNEAKTCLRTSIYKK